MQPPLLWLCIRGWLIQLLQHFISLIPRPFSCPDLIAAVWQIERYEESKHLSNTGVYNNAPCWHTPKVQVFSAIAMQRFLWVIYYKISKHPREKMMTAQMCNMQDLIRPEFYCETFHAIAIIPMQVLLLSSNCAHFHNWENNSKPLRTTWDWCLSLLSLSPCWPLLYSLLCNESVDSAIYWHDNLCMWLAIIIPA